MGHYTTAVNKHMLELSVNIHAYGYPLVVGLRTCHMLFVSVITGIAGNSSTCQENIIINSVTSKFARCRPGSIFNRQSSTSQLLSTLVFRGISYNHAKGYKADEFASFSAWLLDSSLNPMPDALLKLHACRHDG